MNKLLNPGYKILGIGLLLYALVYGLTATLPAMPTLEQSSRNLFYHVPMWFTEVVLMAISVVQSVRFLRLSDPDFRSSADPMEADVKAREAALLGVVFNGLGLGTGIIWSRVSWGQTLPDSDFSAWWVWDPIQTCALLAMLIYLGYFLLRSSYQEPQQRAKAAAVLNIFAFFALIALFFVVPRMLAGLHPTADGENTGLFDTKNVTNTYRLILYPASLGFILLGLWVYELRSRLGLAQLKLENLVADRAYRSGSHTSSDPS